jgi:hypothetical protein
MIQGSLLHSSVKSSWTWNICRNSNLFRTTVKAINCTKFITSNNDESRQKPNHWVCNDLALKRLPFAVDLRNIDYPAAINESMIADFP